MVKIWCWWLGVVGIASACSPSHQTQPDAEPLFHRRSAPHTGITFANQLTETFAFNILEYNNFYTGGGVGIGDFNRDGLPDLYLTGNMVSSALYLNQGGLRFEDVTAAAEVATEGWAAGASVVDINRDGWPDIYVCRSGYPQKERRTNYLFVNQGLNQAGVPVFAEQAATYGLDDPGYTTHAAFFDYDKDGDLDAYLLTSDHDKVSLNTPKPKVAGRTFASTDRLYRNDGGHYHLVSAEAGITHEGYGLGMGVADFNRDGWPDVYTANDFVFEDRMYINNQDGSFTDRSAEYLAYQSRFSMGMDIADFDNDQRIDLMVLEHDAPRERTAKDDEHGHDRRLVRPGPAARLPGAVLAERAATQQRAAARRLPLV